VWKHSRLGVCLTLGNSKQVPVATRLLTVMVQRGTRDITVVLEGNGKFVFNILRVDRKRLSVDLLQVKSEIPFRVLPVDHLFLQKIRIGQHVNKVRIVLDMIPGFAKHIRYGTVEKPPRLAIRLLQV